MRGFTEYVAACLVISALIGAIAWAFTGPAGRQAVLASASLAVAVQTIAFAMARLLQRRHLLLA